MPDKKIDQINKKTMYDAVEHYSGRDQLTASEKSALSYIPDMENKPILDIGVGGGRTVKPLLKLSKNYTGLDYVNEMVLACRSQYPGITFEQADARDLSVFADNSFHLIVFSMNGISMVDHDGRMKILREMHRLLSPGGYFLFSTYNQDNKDYQKILQLPSFDSAKNPFRLGVRGLRYLRVLLIMVFNRARYKRHEVHTEEYSMINDKCHDYATMLYYITQENQRKQLNSMGFSEDILAFGLDGNLLEKHTTDDSILYVAKKDN